MKRVAGIGSGRQTDETNPKVKSRAEDERLLPEEHSGVLADLELGAGGEHRAQLGDHARLAQLGEEGGGAGERGNGRKCDY